MASCIYCKQEGRIFELKNGVCKECREKENDKNAKISTKKNEFVQNELQKIMLTTETSTNFKIEKRIDIITAECAYGMNVFKDLFTGVRDIIGGRSESTQKTLRDAKNVVLNELRNEAYLLGANAVIGVDLDYSEFSGGGKSMLFIVASGTAVIIKNDNENSL